MTKKIMMILCAVCLCAVLGASVVNWKGLPSEKSENGESIENIEQPESEQEENDPGRIAEAGSRLSATLDRLYLMMEMDKISRSALEKQNRTIGLTMEETGYLSVMDVYTNLGVAIVDGYLNIREEPREEGRIVGKLTKNGGCEILETLDGWYKIESGGVTGYVAAAYIVTGDAAKQIASDESSLVLQVDTDVLRVRAEPNTDSRIWDKGYQSESYEVTEDLKNGWVKIHLESNEEDQTGSDGYVFTAGNGTVMYSLPVAVRFDPEEIAAQAQSQVRRDVVDYAMQFLGNPYVWGGTDPNTGADCSGFVQYVLGNSAGIAMSRTSRDQASQGVAVDSNQMKPGDLIFYGSNKGSINHVAMYIGDGQVIHASSKKTGIKISQWNYRSSVAIRDVIGN